MRNKRQDKSWHLIFLSLVFTIVILASCGGSGGSGGGGGGGNSNTPPDTTPPTILSNTPSGGATNVAINITAVSAVFSEGMNPTTINTSTFTVSNGTNNISGNVSLNGTTATFIPSSFLAYSTLYTATVTTGAKDLAGNAMANDYVWKFTTGTAPDTTPPTILSNTPSGGATNVAINITVSAVFSEAMNPTTINNSTFTVSDGTNNIPGTVNLNGLIATFVPSTSLVYFTPYTATITIGVKDLAGNSLTQNYTWGFTTETDTTPPMVVSTNPLNTANGAGLTAQITAAFSEALDPNTITTASFTLSSAGGQVNGTAALSLVGNNLSADYTWRFNTGARLVTGAGHTCARLANGMVKCWGLNEFGQLGLGDINNRGDAAGEMGNNLPAVELGANLTAVELAAGGLHTCAVLDNGTVKCWGNNDNGQLGLGDTNNRGDGANEMGDNLPAVDFGVRRTAVELAAGGLYTCVRLDNGAVKCWGRNDYGQLGLGDTNNRGDGANEMGDNLSAVNLGSGRTALKLVASYYHACALLNNDTVKCWGYNNYGQLGLGDINNRGDEANEMGDNLSAVNLGTGRTAVELAIGMLHTCALLDNGTVKCWGYNNFGQLGLVDINNRGDEANEMGDNLSAVNLGTGRTAVELAVGSLHTCALLDNGTVKCWGYNAEGQLGIGDKINRGDGANEMGDNLPVVDLGAP
ncbi:MAG: Ig-like domain-containing protein [Nitrospirae bacterium]|nr:Ig-like domain-containing protein [Nitrospirota bacterium]